MFRNGMYKELVRKLKQCVTWYDTSQVKLNKKRNKWWTNVYWIVLLCNQKTQTNWLLKQLLCEYKNNGRPNHIVH